MKKFSWKRAHRAARVLGKLGWALLHEHHPLMVQVIPVRRCNLSCAYCNEYDSTSQPVPLPLMLRRIDKLAELGTSIVTISGGEPLLHPELDTIIVRIRERGMIATLITNGYFLSRERIERLNAAGLDHLQISVDNVEPDEVSKKSLRLLEPKLRWLAEHAEFEVNINSVVGGGIKDPTDALAVTRRACELGFTNSVGILHDGRGQLSGLSPEEMDVYRELKRLQGRTVNRVNDLWQDNLAAGKPNEWRCRAGARYLYVDEFGLVNYCSQQRGVPGIPLEQYTVEHVRHEYNTKKGCAPYCTINCVQQTAVLDNWRSPQTGHARLAPGAPRPPVAPKLASETVLR